MRKLQRSYSSLEESLSGVFMLESFSVFRRQRTIGLKWVGVKLSWLMTFFLQDNYHMKKIFNKFLQSRMILICLRN